MRFHPWYVHVAWLFDGWLHVHARWAYPVWSPLCDWVDVKISGEPETDPVRARKEGS